jgi:hypothetical protein
MTNLYFVGTLKVTTCVLHIQVIANKIHLLRQILKGQLYIYMILRGIKVSAID